MDILGFKNISIDNDRLEHVFSFYDSFLDDKKYTKLDYSVFSDTIIVYSKDDSEESLKQIILKSSEILYSMLIERIPMNGCISYGDIFHKETKKGLIISGRPILDALNYQENVDWIGVIISPNLIDNYHHNIEIFNELSIVLAPYQYIPLKNKDNVENLTGFVIKPYKSSSMELGKIADSLEYLRLSAPNAHSQNKYINTIKFLLTNIFNCAPFNLDPKLIFEGFPPN